MGLTRCQLNPYEHECQARVLSCQPTPQAAPLKGAKKSKDSAATVSSTPQTYDVELSDSVLYAESGGQLADHGELICTATGQRLKVTNVQCAPDDKNPSRIIHTCSEPLPADSHVTVRLDWSRRFVHMQTHSGQHLISAIAMRQLQAQTVSWKMSTSATNDSLIELDCESMTDEQMIALQDECNAVIRRAVPMKVHLFDSVDACNQFEGFSTPMLKQIPATLKPPIRVIEIEHTDINPCCGTHAASTSELQLIVINKHEPIASSKHTRIYFLAGERAIQQCTQALNITRQSAALLSTTVEQQVDAIQRLQLELRTASRTNARLFKELAESEAQRLIAAINLSSSDASSQQSHSVHASHREEAPPTYNVAIADLVSKHFEASPAARPYVVLLSSVCELQSTQGQFVLFGDESLVKKYGAECAKILSGKGGGKGRYQGKATEITPRNLTQAIAAMQPV